MKPLLVELLGLVLVIDGFGRVDVANAEIIGGTVTKIEPPANVDNDNHQINMLLGFDEQQNVLLGSPLSTDDPGGFIPAGTYVSSHYVFYDPPGSVSQLIGTAVLDADILGIMTSTALLNASDALGAAGTNYLSPGLRGLEPGDVAVIADSRTVSFDLSAGTPGDYIRVITIPEPSTLALLWLGLSSLFVGRFCHRRNRSQATG